METFVFEISFVVSIVPACFLVQINVVILHTMRVEYRARRDPILPTVAILQWNHPLENMP